MKKLPIVRILVLLNLSGALLVLCLALSRPTTGPIDATGLPRLLARVNGRPVLLEEVQSAALVDDVPLTNERARTVLRDMIAAEAVMQKAVPADPSSAMRLLPYQFAEPAIYDLALSAARLTEKQVARRFARTLGAAEWLRQEAARRVPKPTEAELRAWYEARPTAFTCPPAVQARHFVAVFPQLASPEEQLATANRAREGASQLVQGMSFSDLIAAQSDDPAKAVTGGDLSWFGRHRMDDAIAAAAFALPVGQINGPVISRFGAHYLEIIARRDQTKILPFESVRDEVEVRWTDARRRQAVADCVAEVVAQSKVDILAAPLR